LSAAPLRKFAALERRIHACQLCPRLRRHCEAIASIKRRAYLNQRYWSRPVAGFGDPRARLLLVGLAPAAHGANRTGRMFTGDSSGEWLYAALHAHGFANQPDSRSRDDGLTLRDAFVTAAARCAPPDNRPTPAELARCRPYLEQELELLACVRVVVAMGAIAQRAYLEAAGWWNSLAPRERPKFAHGAESRLPDGRALLTSYHPSRQNTQTGRLTRSMWNAIFARARQLIDRA
jgi:uracil-DNA glycosylase family 4